jgi:hypothetical protein
MPKTDPGGNEDAMAEETERVREKEGMRCRRWIQRGNEDATAEETKRVK